MIWERTFNLALDEATVKQRMMTYFEKAGYKPLGQESQTFRFRRGSTRGSWFPLNPADINTQALVRILPDSSQKIRVKVEFEVDIKFKDETNFTQAFWSDEVGEFGEALAEGKYVPLKSKFLTLRAAWALLKSLGRSLVFILIWAASSFALTFLILRLTGWENLRSGVDPYLVALLVMAAMAIATLFFYRYWMRRQKKGEGRNKAGRD